MSTEAQKHWENIAGSIARVANISWWLQVFLPVLIGLNAVFCVVFLFTRRFDGGMAGAWYAYGALMLGAAVFAYFKARSRFYTKETALIRLEDRLQMKGSLMAAKAGHRPWPTVKEVPTYTFDFQWSVILRPVAFSVVVLLLGLFIPVGKHKKTNLVDLPSQPQAWEQVESWVEELKKTDLVDEAALQKVEEKLAELQSRPVQEWYQPDSLEAGENLEETVEQNIHNLTKGLSMSSAMLEEMANAIENNDMTATAELQEQLREQLEKMASGTMPLNKEVAEQLQGMCESGAGSSLSAEELKKMAQEMGDRAQTGGKIAGPGSIPQDQMVTLEPTAGEGGEENGNGAGAGGITRGPGAAPMYYNQNPDLVAVNDFEAVSNPDRDKMVVGETIGVTRVEQPADDVEFGGVRGGFGTDNRGEGGQTTFRGNFTPEERDILQGYFK